MATNGIISITKENRVIFKCVAGCDGYNAKQTAKAIKKSDNYTLSNIYDICMDNGFGCKNCLVVQSEDDYIAIDGELDNLYTEKFSDPKFNPRWECGIASHVEIIVVK